MPNKFNFADFGMQAAQDVVGAGLGLALGGINDKRQLKQQAKLQKLQIQGQKEMTSYNQAAALKMWQDTNYSAQMDQLKKAGLNPGMIYGMSGSGGATAAVQGGNITGTHAPTGGGEAIAMGSTMAQLGLMRAQKENIEADTANKKADIPVKTAQETNIQASTASLTQGVQSAKAQQKLTEIQQQLGEVDLKLKETTLENQKSIINLTLSKMIEDVRILENEREISDATKDEKISIIEKELIGIYLRNQLTKEQTKLTGKQIESTGQGIKESEAKIQNMTNQILLARDQLKNETDKTEIQKKLANFETSFGKQASDVLKSVLGTVGEVRGRKTTVTHRGGQTNETYHYRD